MSEEDRELLRLAAEAAGYEVNIAKGGGAWINDGSKVWPHWNALNDDGDALRLAGTLHINMEWSEDARCGATFEIEGKQVRMHNSSMSTAAENMRRLIVRAAAALAKATA